MSEHKFKLLSPIKSNGRTLFYIEHETHGLQIVRTIPKYLKTTAQYILYNDELIIEIVYPKLIEKFGLCIDQIDYINQQLYVCWKGQHWIYGDDHNFHQIIFPVEIIKTLGNYFNGANYLFALGIDNQLYMCKIPNKTHDNTPINCDLVAELCNTDANILDISFYCRMFINSQGQLYDFVIENDKFIITRHIVYQVPFVKFENNCFVLDNDENIYQITGAPHEINEINGRFKSAIRCICGYLTIDIDGVVRFTSNSVGEIIQTQDPIINFWTCESVIILQSINGDAYFFTNMRKRGYKSNTGIRSYRYITTLPIQTHRVVLKSATKC